MHITNVIGGKELGQLEELMEKNHGKKGNSSIPTISINTLEYATTYKNGKLGIRVSVKVDRNKISPEEFSKIRQIISPKKNQKTKITEERKEYGGSGC